MNMGPCGCCGTVSANCIDCVLPSTLRAVISGVTSGGGDSTCYELFNREWNASFTEIETTPCFWVECIGDGETPICTDPPSPQPGDAMYFLSMEVAITKPTADWRIYVAFNLIYATQCLGFPSARYTPVDYVGVADGSLCPTFPVVLTRRDPYLGSGWPSTLTLVTA